MNFIFFWRLAREKGFDLVVGALSEIVEKTGELPGNVFIFGEGDLKKELFQSFTGNTLFEDCSSLSGEEILEKIEFLSNLEYEEIGCNEEIPPTPLYQGGNKIYFFGWQSQAILRSILEISHFSLIPSRFLETFGLAALESLSEGVPVIGFQKGGLIPFISKELVIPFFENDNENTKALANKIVEISEKYSSFSALMEEEKSDWEILSHESRRIADGYTEGRWIRQVQDMLPSGTKKILLASDYTTLLGGIETHVQTIARALRQQGYEVEIFGWDITKWRWTKVLRLMGLVYSLCNITSALAIRKKIREFQPDVVWLHSVSRFLGPLTVREVADWRKNKEISTLVTYHDLGLLSPFPSRVESEEMIPKNPSLGAFFSSVHSGNPIVYLAVFCKYFQVLILRKLLKRINIHIVPSAFLVPHIRDIIEVPDEKIVTLEHFL